MKKWSTKLENVHILVVQQLLSISKLQLLRLNRLDVLVQLLPAKSPILSQTITVKYHNHYIGMANHHGTTEQGKSSKKLLKKAYKKKVQQNQTLVAEAKTSTKDTSKRQLKYGKKSIRETKGRW